MASKWEVNRAVRGSNLPAPSRLIMLTLSDVADAETGEIPEKFTPSLTVLGVETGLGRSTVARFLKDLEKGGWVVRTRPSSIGALVRGERTQYRLSIPEPSPTTGLVPEGDQPSPTAGQPSPAPRQPSPATGHKRRSNNRSQPEDDQSSPPKRLDVEEICQYLVEKIVANGSKRPRISPRWRTEARMLLDHDGRTVAQVKNAIDWCQADPFWRSVIMSMPKLRDKYDQLRMAAMRPNGRSPTVDVNGHKLNPETARRLADRSRFQAQDAEIEQRAIGS